MELRIGQAAPDAGRDPQLAAACRLARAVFKARYAAVAQGEGEAFRQAGCEDAALDALALGEMLGRAPPVADRDGRPFLVLDTLADGAAGRPPVTNLGEPIRFFVIAPLGLPPETAPPDPSPAARTVLCVFDTAPRLALSPGQERALADLAVLVRAILLGRDELGREAAERRRSEALAAELQRLLAASRQADRLAEAASGFGRWSIDLAAAPPTITWSAGLARIVGREDRAGLPLPLETHVLCHHPDEREGLRTVFRLEAEGRLTGVGERFAQATRLLRPDGEMRDVVVHGNRIRDAGGAVVAVQGVTIDTTDLARSEKRSRHAEDLLRTTLEHMDQGLVMVDAAGHVRVFNRRALDLLGVFDAVLAAGAPIAGLARVLAGRGDLDLVAPELRGLLAEGRFDGLPNGFFWTRSSGTMLAVRHKRLPDGGVVLTFADITIQRRATLAMQESEQRLRLITENTHDVIILGGADLRRLYASPAVRTMLGYEAVEFLGIPAIDLVHPDDAPIFSAIAGRMRDDALDRQVECLRCRHKAGHYVWVETSIQLLRDGRTGGFAGYVACMRDVTTRREAEDRLRHMALHDTLTGLPNRALFRDRLETVIAGGRGTAGFAVLACDLDRFKAVNDSFGHSVGDALLRDVAQRMAAVLRPGDTMARLGGDEFAVLLPQQGTRADAVAVAARIIEAVSGTFEVDGRGIELGVSIGLTVAAGVDGSAEEIFKRADIALYEAKAAGRNTFREFEPGAGARAAERGQLALDMKEAIRREAFRLVYQPVVDLGTGRVAAFEALLRWTHPRHGAIAPARFIPVAEETGLIVPLGAWALREAAREAARWPGGVRVAVNVSALQLRREGLHETVRDVLSATGLPAARLELEVTESVMMEDAAEVLDRLRGLRALGLTIALDDFGTGYSSLGYLRRFRFDKVKIDRSFIRDLGNADTAAIVRAVVGIGRKLGMRIVAEGVETAGDLARVRRLGCREVQGYCFSEPMGAEAVAACLQADLSRMALIMQAAGGRRPVPAVTARAAPAGMRSKAG